jgi:RNA polymerase sigma-70 factor (ECF subfamily)
LAEKALIKEFTDRIDKHQGILFKVSRMYCGDEECQKDLFQEIVLQLWKSYPNFNQQSKFSTWMYRVALNTAIAQFRSSQKEIISFKSVVPTDYPEENEPEKNEDTAILYKAIGRLNKAEKSLIILYLDNFKYAEIAEITGISVSNVGVKINRIKSKLQKILKELGYGF